MPFTRNALIRAIRTAAQTAIGAIGAATLVAQVDWALVASTVVLATRGFTGSATYTGTLPDVTAVSWTASTTMPAPYCRWRIERI